MKKCPNCNRAYSDMVKVCNACGTDLSANAAPARLQNTQNTQNTQSYRPAEQEKETRVVQAEVVQKPVQTSSGDDKSHYIWLIPGFFIPLVGWILHHKWKYTKPLDAKMANIGAWIGFVSGMLMMLMGA